MSIETEINIPKCTKAQVIRNKVTKKEERDVRRKIVRKDGWESFNRKGDRVEGA